MGEEVWEGKELTKASEMSPAGKLHTSLVVTRQKIQEFLRDRGAWWQL